MAMLATLLSVLAVTAVMAAQPAAAAAPSPVILACNLPARTAPGVAPSTRADRIFRVGPGSLQEWDAARRQFGSNLCGAFACVRTANRSEGTISSASVSYTIGVAQGVGYWRVVGASTGGARSGSCRTVTEPKR